MADPMPLSPKQVRLVNDLVFEVGNALGVATEESLAEVRAAVERAVRKSPLNLRRAPSHSYRRSPR